MAARTLAARLARIGAVLLVMALCSIGLTAYVTRQLDGGAAAVNEAGRMRMQAWRLAAGAGGSASLAERQAWVGQFDQSLKLLREGDPSRPLFMPRSESVQERFAAVVKRWNGAGGAKTLLLNPSDGAGSAREVEPFVAAIDELVGAIESELSGQTAVLNVFQIIMMTLAVGGAVIMIYTGHVYVISPLARVQQGLRRIEAGEFDARVDAVTRDEFGEVAAGFNRMAQTLQSMYAGLEDQVRRKTQDIDAQRRRLQTLYEVSAFLAEATTIDTLTRGFAARVRAHLGADAVAIRWSDEAQGRYVMLGSEGLPEDMAREEHSLVAGVCACGNLATDARSRVIPIHTDSPLPIRHCMRVGYAAVVSTPVRLHQRILGEINLFYRRQPGLSAEELHLLETLASHLASSLEGLRAAALEREALVGEERALLARELHDSIAQSMSFLKIQVQLLRAAVRNTQGDKVDQILEELDHGLKESISDVRELLLHFRTRTNQSDIEAALAETLQKFRLQTKLAAHLEVQGSAMPLPADTQTQVLHIVHEALSNARKHARASAVEVQVFKGPQWRFVVRDDGQGFSSEMPAGAEHVGLHIMQERAARIGAVVEVRSTPQVGTEVELTLPHPLSRGASEVASPVASCALS